MDENSKIDLYKETGNKITKIEIIQLSILLIWILLH